MRQWFILGIALLLTSSVWAQRMMDPYPYLQSPTKAERKAMRVEEREKRDAADTRTIDSLVLSRNWQFLPVTMQQQIAGPIRNLYRYYYVTINPSSIQVYLPFVKGYVNSYFTLLNFDILNPQDYIITRTVSGWEVRFSGTSYKGGYYTFVFEITTPTWEVTLNISSIQWNTITYTGTMNPN